MFPRAWSPLILLTVLELVSQSSNFARITILRNGMFSPFFNNVLFVRNESSNYVYFYRKTYILDVQFAMSG